MGRSPKFPKTPSSKISDYYGENAFTLESMREHLTEEAFYHVMDAIEKGDRIDRKVADQIASSLKEWAMARAVTH